MAIINIKYRSVTVDILYKNIKRRREELGLSQDLLAQKVGYTSRSSIAKIENGDVDIPRSKIIAFASALRCSPMELMGWDNHEPRIDIADEACMDFPIIGEVAAGFGSLAVEEETGDYEQIPVSWLHGDTPDNFFVLRVKGNSMYPAYQHGDHVLVHRQTSVDSGSVAVVLYEDENATLKKVKYVYGEDWLELIPINPEYAPKRIENQDLENCRVLGEVRRLIRVVK